MPIRGRSISRNHLYGLGHRDIAFIAGPEALRSAGTRREAFASALQPYGLNPERTVKGNHKVDGGMSAARALLVTGDVPTAVLCSNDLTAIGAMVALREAGLRIPEDISVIGFDDIYFASITTPPLTTISLPLGRIGELAFEALQNILRTKKRQGSESIVDTELIIRQSTAPPRR